MFLTTGEFLPHHHDQRQTLQLITAAEANGHTRLVEMNRQVLGGLDQIITSLTDSEQAPMRADNSQHVVAAARQRSRTTRRRAVAALRALDNASKHISFDSVEAKVSRSWLYGQPYLRAEIERLRSGNVPPLDRCPTGHAPPTPRSVSGCNSPPSASGTSHANAQVTAPELNDPRLKTTIGFVVLKWIQCSAQPRS